MYIRKQLLDSGKGDVNIKIFINKCGKYVMCPYGRSCNKKWIGMAKLDYFIVGNYKSDTQDIFVGNILKCIDIGINYDELNIEKCSNINDLVTVTLKNAKKNKYEDFHVISIDLSDINEYIEVVKWEKVSNSSNEWRGNPDTVKLLSYERLTTDIFNVIVSFLNYK